MKSIYSASLFMGVVIVSLLAPSLMTAKTFHYIGLKTGFSYEMLSKSIFSEDDSHRYLDASSAVGVPLGVSVGFGYYFSPRFGMRIEAEYLYRFMGKFNGGVLKSNNAQSIPSGDPIKLKLQAEFQTLLGNLYLDYHVSPWVSLYLSVGAGAANFNVVTELQNNSRIGKITSPFKRTLAWQAGFGIGYMLVEGLEVDLNVRYINFGEGILPSTQSRFHGKYPFSATETLVSLIYRF